MADEYTVDHTSTYEHFEYVLSLGKDKYGKPLDLNTFDEESIKTKRQLYTETQLDAVFLRYDPEAERTRRFSISARLRIFELRRKIFWQEVARSYPSGKVDIRHKHHSLSETLKRGESGIDAVLRCKKQEIPHLCEAIGYAPTAVDIIPRIETDIVKRIARFREGRSNLDLKDDREYVDIETHESSVYYGIPSTVTNFWYDTFLDIEGPKRTFGKDIVIVKDDDGRENNQDWVQLYLRPTPYDLAGI